MEKRPETELSPSGKAPQVATVCVIDDNRDNLDLMEQELTDVGYRVVTAADGPSGLEVIDREQPDLILLDIMMPGLSGYEVCSALRQRAATASLPIILVTAKTGSRDEVVGLDAGANDYVIKPINIETLLARIRTQLRIKRLQDELRHNYESFIRLDRARQEMISMLTHDLKTPLMTVTASAKLLCDPEHPQTPGRVAEISGIMLKSTQKMQEMIEDFLSLARWERSGLATEIEVCDLAQIVTEAVDIFGPLVRDRDVRLKIDLPAEPALVFADSILLSRVWQNLLSNAIKYNRPQGEVVLTVQRGEDHEMICRVTDTGIGISEDALPNVFDAFYRSEGRKVIEGTGLGLAVVKAILEAHHSPHSITSRVGEGTEFTFLLQAAESPDASPPPWTAAGG